MSKDNEPEPANDGMVIRLHFDNAFCITTEEYEKLSDGLVANLLAGDVTLADQIINRLLAGGLYRYNDIKRMRAERAEPSGHAFVWEPVCECCGSDNITTLETMPVQYLCECGSQWT